MTNKRQSLWYNIELFVDVTTIIITQCIMNHDDVIIVYFLVFCKHLQMHEDPGDLSDDRSDVDANIPDRELDSMAMYDIARAVYKSSRWLRQTHASKDTKEAKFYRHLEYEDDDGMMTNRQMMVLTEELVSQETSLNEFKSRPDCTYI